MEKYLIKIGDKRGTVYTDSTGFVELRLGKVSYTSAADFLVTNKDAVLITSNKELGRILSDTGFIIENSQRKRVPWRLYVEPLFIDKIDYYIEAHYPLNRSDVVNLAISSTLDSVEQGYITKRGTEKKNICFNIEKEFADKISDMSAVYTKNSILLACLDKFFKEQ